MPRATTGRIGERLIAAGHLNDEQLQIAIEHQRGTGQFLGDTLDELQMVSPAVLGPMIAERIQARHVPLAGLSVEPEVLGLLTETYQRDHDVLPYLLDDGILHVAMRDPMNVLLVDEVQMLTKCRISPSLALNSEIQLAFRRLHKTQGSAVSVLDELLPKDAGLGDTDMSADHLAHLAEDAPIVRLANSIISAAIISRSSDVHIEPQADTVRVRYRTDGVLYEQMRFPIEHLAAVVSRLKIMAHMNIAERRRPQDGRILYRADGHELELRVSTMLMAHGEKVVMRVLDQSALALRIDDLGFFPQQLAAWESFLRRPHGIILVTGPTGSGKSTTLYTSLDKINKADTNIITVEDPIEYDLPGVNQSQVNPKIGVTFASALRTIVRQDPDIIMVGEIRDPETAAIAVQAALTGHLVLSTLHTNDAPGALVRLKNLGVEPYLITSAVVGAIGQRLVRRVCEHCAEPVELRPGLAGTLGIGPGETRDARLRRGKGCVRCAGRGVRGRLAVYEVMPMSEPLCEAVLAGASGVELRKLAIDEGMMAMREAGIRRVLAGETTVEEIGRVLLGELDADVFASAVSDEAGDADIPDLALAA